MQTSLPSINNSPSLTTPSDFIPFHPILHTFPLPSRQVVSNPLGAPLALKIKPRSLVGMAWKPIMARCRLLLQCRGLTELTPCCLTKSAPPTYLLAHWTPGNAPRLSSNHIPWNSAQAFHIYCLYQMVLESCCCYYYYHCSCCLPPHWTVNQLRARFVIYLAFTAWDWGFHKYVLNEQKMGIKGGDKVGKKKERILHMILTLGRL